MRIYHLVSVNRYQLQARQLSNIPTHFIATVDGRQGEAERDASSVSAS